MSHYFQKPENALKRATELVGVGQKMDALNALHNVVTSRRNRTWQKPLEDIMFRYIDLGVELGKGRQVKDGLHQFRIACAQVPQSLEAVLSHLLKRSQEAAAKAQTLADQKLLETMGDLGDDGDSTNTPKQQSVEAQLLTAVSGEDAKDRNDREIVTPWLKFLWEAYRTVLDILKANRALEALYHSTAQQAFKFCHEFKRKHEFRRLCDMLRHHLASMQQPARPRTANQAEQPARIDLEDPETQQRHLQTRFVQLNVASELELWQEAFKAIEDIRHLIKLSKKTPKAHLMAIYYEKLARIFFVSGNELFHAYAMYRFYVITRNQNRSVTPEQLRALGSRLLLAALAIPLERSDPGGVDGSGDELSAALDALSSSHERNARMASLLGLGTAHPRRQTLLNDLIAGGLLRDLLPEVRALYAALMQPAAPFTYAADVLKRLEAVKALEVSVDMSPGGQSAPPRAVFAEYEGALRSLMFTRLFQQLSTVYDTLTFDAFPKVSCGTPFVDVEPLLLRAAKARLVAARIDHRAGLINFASATSLGDASMRYQLRDVHSHAKAALAALALGERQAHRERAAAAVVASPRSFQASLDDEHRRLLERRVVIENQKEEEERVREANEIAERERRERERAEAREAEAERVKREVERRQKAAAERRMQEIERREAADWVKMVVGAAGKDEAEDEGGSDAQAAISDPQAFMKAKIETLTRERQAMEERMNELARRLDFIERATRKEELPLLEKECKEREAADRKYFEDQVRANAEQHRAQWAFKLAEKKRLVAIKPYAEKVREEKRAEFEAEFQERKRERDARVEQRRQELTNGLLSRRRAEAKRRKQEEERIRAEEEKLRVAEERRQRELEERERRHAESFAQRRDMEDTQGRELRGQWKDRDAVPPRGGGFDDRGPPRGGGFDDRGPPRRGGFDDRGPPSRGGGFDDRGPPRRGGFDDRGPPPRGGGFDDRGPPRRGGFDDRGPPPRGGGFDDRGPPRRGGFDDRGPPPRGGGFDDRGPPRRGGFDDRGPPPRGGGFDDRGPPPRRGGFDDRGPPRRGGFDDRGPPPRGGGFDDRGPPPRGMDDRGRGGGGPPGGERDWGRLRARK